VSGVDLREPLGAARSMSGELFEEFLSSCRASGRSVQALRALRYRLPKLLEYLREIGGDLYSLGPREAQGYTGWFQGQLTRSGAPYAASSVASYVQVASSFFSYLKKRGVVLSNPFAETRRLRAPKKLPKGLLKEKEMESLLEHLSRFDESSHLKDALARYRLHVVAELMYSTGIRVSEAAALTSADIDFTRSTIRIREGKGGIERTAFLGEFAREALRLYLERARGRVFIENQDRDGRLLFGARGAWFGNWVRKELKRHCAALGLPLMTSHGFRHAVGYHLLRAGCPIRYIQAILGHRRLRNTEVYTKVEKEDLKKVVDTFHPRKWKAERVAS
jgi:site-specific recombinase XerD